MNVKCQIYENVFIIIKGSHPINIYVYMYTVALPTVPYFWDIPNFLHKFQCLTFIIW